MTMPDSLDQYRGGSTRLAIAAEMIYGAGWLFLAIGEFDDGSAWGWVALLVFGLTVGGLYMRLEMRQTLARIDERRRQRMRP